MKTFEQEEEEVWLDLEGFDDRIEVSSMGNFRRKADKFTYKLGHYSNGYLQFSVGFNSVRQTGIAHRLIAKTFIPNPENKPEVNHKNGIRDDNRVQNLEWVTRSENIKHSIDVLNRAYPDRSGELNGRNILTEAEVKEIRESHLKGARQCDLAVKYNVNPPVIYKIVKRINWKHI